MPTRYKPAAGGVAVPIGKASVVELPPRIRRVRFIGAHFETARCFLTPDAIPGAAQIKKFHDRHPRCDVLIVGHADTAGDPDYNRALSVERAESMRAFLADDVDGWASWFADNRPAAKRWGTREVQHMLSRVGDGQAVFYDGAISGADDDATRAAVRRFQDWSNRARRTALAVDGIAGPKTRPEIVRAYMKLDDSARPFAPRALVHGCGEWHPIDATGDEQRSLANRRVELFFFEGPVTPPPRTCAAPGCPEYPDWVKGVVEEIDIDAPSENSGVVTFRLIDEAGQRMAGVELWIRHPDGVKRRHVADDQGEVRLPGKPEERFAVVALCDTQVTTEIAAVTVKPGEA